MRICFRRGALTFIVESVNTVNTGALVITPQDEKVFWIFDFVRQQETNRLERLFPTIDVVTEEEIICLRWKATIFKKTKKIIVLSMDVT